MDLHSEWIDLDAGGQPARALVVRPAMVAGPLPGLVVIQEAFGVDGHIEDVARRLATAGYAAIAPDLFSIGGKPAALAPARVERLKQFLDGVPTSAWLDPVARAPYLEKMGAEAQAIGETFAFAFPKERPWDAYVAALRASVAALAAGASRGRRIGSIGFCMGGALSLRLACVEPALGGAALYYGIGPPAELLDGLRAPVLGLYAEDDPRITPTVPALAETLRARGKSYVYEVFAGTRHAFNNDTRKSYHPEAARQAWARTLAFFAQHL